MRGIAAVFMVLIGLGLGVSPAAAAEPQSIAGPWRQLWKNPETGQWSRIALVGIGQNGPAATLDFYPWTAPARDTTMPTRIENVRFDGQVFSADLYFPVHVDTDTHRAGQERHARFELRRTPAGHLEGPVTLDGRYFTDTRFEPIAGDRALQTELESIARAYDLEIGITQGQIAALGQQIDFYQRMVAEDRRRGVPDTMTRNQMFLDMTQRTLLAEQYRLQALMQQTAALRDARLRLDAALAAGPTR